jgi:Holliday junction resolvasome RuvABC endonuclease subunit
MGMPLSDFVEYAKRGGRAQDAVNRAIAAAAPPPRTAPTSEAEEWAETRARLGIGKVKKKWRPRDVKSKRETPVLPKIPDLGCRVLAIDPSITACGWAVLGRSSGGWLRIDSGTWKPSEAKGKPSRFVQLHRFLDILILTHKPAVAIVELPQISTQGGKFKVGAKTLITYGRAVGTCHSACLASMHEENVAVVDVEEWKGRTKKGYWKGLVETNFKCRVKDENESDALGIALWFVTAGRQAE